MQTKLRTYDIVPNNNISFPIGTILTVEKLYDLLDLPTVFGKHKKQGIDINKLLKALVSYKLTDNFSIKKIHIEFDSSRGFMEEEDKKLHLCQF